MHQVYLPMNDCIEMGLAVFTTDPNGSASAVFSNVNAQSNVGNNLAAPEGAIQPAVQPKRKAYINPNPTNGQIRLSLSTPTRSPGIVTVWNEFGQPVRKLPLSPGVEEMTWDLQDLPAGLYVLQMLTEDGFREVFKMVKQ